MWPFNLEAENERLKKEVSSLKMEARKHIGLKEQVAHENEHLKEQVCSLMIVAREHERLQEEAVRERQMVADENERLKETNRQMMDGWEDILGSPLDFYDLIINMQRLQDYTVGWPIFFSEDEQYILFQSTFASFVVSISGDFNVGKSWILSQISGKICQYGERVHTVGISIKLVNLAESVGPQVHPSQGGHNNSRSKKAWILDAQGLNSPVMPSRCPLEENLQEMKAMEEFQRQVVLSVSDVFIFVVGQLSAKNQLDLLLLLKAIKVLRKRFRGTEQRVFVVHNLRDWTHEQFQAARYIQRIQQVYNPMLKSADSCEGFEYLWGQYKEKTESSSADVRIRFEHLFLTRSGSPHSQNELVFAYIRNTLHSMELDDTCLSARLAEAMHNWIPNFLHVAESAPIPKLIITDGVADSDLGHPGMCSLGQRIGYYKPLLRPNEPIRTIVRTRPLGSMVSLASNDLAYNLNELPCEVQTRRGGQRRMIRLLCIEVPGLDYTSFKCVVNHKRSGEVDIPDDVNLVVFTLDSDSDVVEVRLKAILESQPAQMTRAREDQDEMPCEELLDDDGDGGELKTMKLYSKLVLSSFGDLSNMDDYHSKVVDKGTRCIDHGEHFRRVNFRVGLSEEEIGKWDRQLGAYYCYCEGILSVGFVSQNKVRNVAAYVADRDGNIHTASSCPPAEEREEDYDVDRSSEFSIVSVSRQQLVSMHHQ